ncbi:MAG: molybdopterin biosynthesis protein [Thermodesulfovibrio sp.]|nr:molybdopterin biosynthesis protein [Thermodesulfovibrio sp.]
MKMKKGIYLDNTPLEQALKIWQARLTAGDVLPLEAEEVPVQDAFGRVTANAVFAKISSPFYHASAMDGYAVRFADTFGASEALPKKLLLNTDAIAVDTGDPLPDGFSAVIMIEDVNLVAGETLQGASVKGHASRGMKQEYIEILKPATPWQHVRVIGEDIVSTELILPENNRIRAVDLGAVIAGGHVSLAVRKRPVVVIIPTGSEIVEPGTSLKKGDIIEYNSRILASLVQEWGGIAIRYAPVPDDREKLREAVLKACSEGDLVIVNAGSSAGSEDYTAGVLSEIGEVLLHGINIKPGKPVILAWAGNTPVLGIPGYPVSAYITSGLFARPVVYRLQGLEPPQPEIITARLSRQVASSLGQEEFLRVKVGRVGENLIATPVSRGAGVLMSLVRADGFVRVPAVSEGYGAGTEVSVEMLRSGTEIENTVVCIGSHDNALDLLANILKKKHPRYSLSSAHVGSMGGLVAIKKGEAHMAGTHMLDEETGEYNVAFIRRLLGERKVLLVNLVYREQGLMVLKGNPKNIQGFHDLVRDDVVFINRQGGAGTRMLTDKNLKEFGLDAGRIRGYEREEYTHMGVASAVLTGIADTGLGILASAQALGLDFVPVARERYDLVIPADYADMPKMRALLEIIRDNAEFRDTVTSLGGYDLSDMGKIMYEQ